MASVPLSPLAAVRSRRPRAAWPTALFFILLLVGAAAGAQSSRHQARVVEAWPRGPEVILAADQKLYVRIDYRTDSMTRIFVQPYLDGEPVQAWTSPSPRYEGQGETVAWVAFTEPGRRADEIRVFVGNSRRALADRFRVEASSRAIANDPGQAPEWVGRLETQLEAQTGGPQPAPGHDAGGGGAATGLMAGVVALFVLAVGMSIHAVRHWQGRWRIAAAVPVAGLGVFTAGLLLVALFNPSSLGLLPFVVLMGAGPAAAYMVVLVAARRMLRAGRTNHGR